MITQNLPNAYALNTKQQIQQANFSPFPNSKYLVDFTSVVSGVSSVVKTSRAGDVVLRVVLVGHCLSWSVIVHPHLQ